MTDDTLLGIDLEVRIRARPETVFKYFTDATLYRRWMGDEAELDPRPGGLYRVHFPGRPSAEGQFLVVRPPDRVVFSWGWTGSAEIPPGSTTVEVDLTADGAETVVRIVHRGVPSGADRAQHTEGWHLYLARLSTAVTGATQDQIRSSPDGRSVGTDR
jgi:uncharacterized protein YndB with AHSA1/START domain